MPVTINYYSIMEEVSEYVRELFSSHHNSKLIYHNLRHTKHVVEKCVQIASYYQLNEKNLFILKTAAWFHDCGHLFGPDQGHEIKSVQVMNDKLGSLKVDSAIIEEIKKCILATKLPAMPVSLNEKIICDADLYELGTSQFLINNDLLREEFKLRNGYVPEDLNWHTLKFLTSHCYFTNYCQAVLNAGKEHNITYIKELIARDN